MKLCRLSEISRKLELQGLGNSIRCVRALQDFREDSKKINNFSLLYALCRSASFNSTEPRDRFFALLGPVDDAHYLMPMPNYQESDQDLASTFNRRMIDRADNLNIPPSLCSSSDHSKPSWLSSWFSLEKDACTRALQHDEKLQCLKHDCKWNVIRNSKPRYDIDFRGTTLYVKSIIIDKVHNVFTYLSESPDAKNVAFSLAIGRPHPCGNSSSLGVRICTCLDLMDSCWIHGGNGLDIRARSDTKRRAAHKARCAFTKISLSKTQRKKSRDSRSKTQTYL